MQFVSSCAINKVAAFFPSSPASNSIQWVSFSNVKANGINSFGASTQASNSQQILCVSASKTPRYYYIQGPFTTADFGKLNKSSRIQASQVPASIGKAIAAVGLFGNANMLTTTVPASGASPSPSFVGSIPVGISVENLFVPVCAGKPNWLSISVYGIIALLLVWWFWIRRA